MKKWFAYWLALMLFLPMAVHAETQVKTLGLPLGESYVYYPQLDGMADAEVQAQVNQALLEGLGVPELLNRIALTMNAADPLQADYAADLAGDVLSCVLYARGPVQFDRYTERYHTVNVDLTTGETVTLEDLFADPEAAAAAMEEYMDYTVASELSAHLQNSELLPLPETFGLNATGITFYYDMEKLSTLSDKAGTVTILWCEVLEHLRLEEGGILERIGAKDMLTMDAGKIRETVEKGVLPGLPVQLGESVQKELDEHRLLLDPDLYEGGRMFQLEDGAFRGAWLLSDSLMEDDWSHSVVQGVRADRLNMYGLMCGVTTREEYLAALGDADSTVQVDWEQADAYRLAPGTSDYYTFGDYRLRLHADEDGVLSSVFLLK